MLALEFVNRLSRFPYPLGYIAIVPHGRTSDKNLAFALHNPWARRVRACLAFTSAGSGQPSTLNPEVPSAVEWITGRELAVEAAGGEYAVHINLPANGYAVVGIGSDGMRPRPD